MVPIRPQDQFAVFITNVLVPELRNTIDRICDLGFPTGNEAMLDQLMTDTETVLDDLAKDLTSIFTMKESPFANIDAQLMEYGLTECGG